MVNKLLLILFTISLLTANNLFSQSGTSAVMQVRAEILPATQFDSHNGQEISIRDTGDVHRSDVAGAAELHRTLGSFTLQVPAGADYTAGFDSEISLRSGNAEMRIDTRVQEMQESDGRVTYRISGSNLETLPYGRWEGSPVAVIEFH